MNVVRLVGAAVSATLLLAPTAVATQAATASTPASPNGRIWFHEGYDGSVGSVAPAGGTPALLPPGGDEPAVSPDGTRVAYDGAGGIYVVDADGTDAHQVTDDDGTNPDWSPDGTRLVYQRGDDLATVGVAGGASTVLLDLAENLSDPAWSPTGTTIAFTAEGCDSTGGGSCVYTVPAAGGRAQNLTTQQITCPDGTSVDLDASSSQPAWSPDGARIAFTGYPDCTGVGTDIWTMNADGSGKADLTHDDGTPDASPTWSPDGSTIAFLSDRTDSGQRDLFTVPAAGGAVAAVPIAFTHASDHPSGPDWAPAVVSRTPVLRLAAAHTRVAKGTTVALTGRLLPAYGGQRLVLQAQHGGSWSTLPGAHPTARSGSVGLRLTVKRSGRYRLVYAGSTPIGLAPASSPAVTISVTSHS